MELRFKIEGFDKVQRRLKDLSPAVVKELASTLFQEAEETMGESKEHHVPVDTGRLRNTGHVQPPEITADGISVMLGYDTTYAIYVHEDLSARHNVGSAKYLERPLLAAAARIRAALAAAVTRAIR